jgi:exonuclease SbcC
MTDIHFKGVNPENRLDNYADAVCLKLESFGWGVAQNGIQFVLIGGDVFDIPKISNQLLGRLSEIMRNWGVPVYVMPGNHDVYGHNMSTLMHTSLGLLAKTGVVNLLTRNNSPYLFHIGTDQDCPVVALTAMEYIDDGSKCSDVYDPRDYQVDRMKGEVNILMAHAMIMPNPSPHFQCIDVAGIDTNADVVLCSHWHQHFEYTNQNGTLFLNPGATGRTDANAYNINPANKPAYLMIDITRSAGVKYLFMHYPAAMPGDQIFDLKAVQANKAHQVTLATLKQQLKATVQPGSNIISDIYTILDDVIKQRGVNPGLRPNIVQHIQNSEHKMANESMMAQGYIPAYKSVYIRRIGLRNFQSHKDTDISLDESGFNAIVGESDKGKSSVIRAIQWVLYNEPAGTDMIRTGENECEVCLEFSNDMVVQRTRTRNDAGSYLIWNKVTGQKTPLKKFGRNVPIEVFNAHQIPKGANIQSQLEGPYMLSATAPERAALIGSIVGTDIVDAAIKEVGGEIIGLQKASGIHEKTVADLTTKLQSFDDLTDTILLEDKLRIAIEAIDLFEQDCVAIQQLQTAYQQADYERGQAEYYLSFYQNIDKVDAIIKEAELLNMDYKAVADLELGYRIEKQNTHTLGEKLKTYAGLDQTSALMAEIDAAVTQYVDLLNLYNQHDIAEKAIQKTAQDLQRHSGLDRIDLTTIESLYAEVVDINAIQNRYIQAVADVATAEQNLATCIDPTDIATEYQNLLVQLGSCPTCGAQVTANAAHLIEL